MPITSDEIINLTDKEQAYVLHRFLFNLTMTVRDIYSSNEHQVLEKMYAINGLYHHIIPFIDHLLFGIENSFTIDVICRNIQDTGTSCGLEHHFGIAWQFSLQQAGYSRQ